MAGDDIVRELEEFDASPSAFAGDRDLAGSDRIRFAVLLPLSLMYFIAYIDRTNISVAAPLMSKEDCSASAHQGRPPRKREAAGEPV
jgi:hypothetical protein